ncbi:MAG TPA: GNAT family N-acetyltransferase [Chthoniobacterales bacterium]|nr:GNAT family N-acetyltransferase [Chthoniobacterales bacterium]
MCEYSVTEIDVRPADINSPTVCELITALNAELKRQYPEEGATHFRLEANEVAEGRGAFLVAYAGRKPIGCGAVRKIDSETAEIKRMYVVPEARGRGVSKKILLALEQEARRLGLRRIVLETGDRQVEAMGLYTRAGFTRIPLFGEYVNSPLSVCMAKEI